ncbi:MAG: hypothetical protein DPW16_00025 [Chloroflexi bacterium]|nr:hypothetical protein [Chloroflexota bacterium]
MDAEDLLQGVLLRPIKNNTNWVMLLDRLAGCIKWPAMLLRTAIGSIATVRLGWMTSIEDPNNQTVSSAGVVNIL